MKIAYIVTGDPYDKNSWSGTDYFVRSALEKCGTEVYYIYGLPVKKTILFYVNKIFARLQKKSYDPLRTIAQSKRWAKLIHSKLQPGTDCILSLSTIPVAYLKVNIPIYLYIDGVFEQIRNYYPSNFRNKDILIGNELEFKALNMCRRIFTASNFTKDAVSSLYSIPTNLVQTIPLGANIEEYPDVNEINTIINNRRLDKNLQLLFVGVDWYRKGADLLIKTSEELRKSGININVNLVGIRDIPQMLPDYIHNYGFLNKNKASDFRLLQNLYKESSFLVVPSRAEAYGLVFCEANAYGLPIFSLNEGGIKTIVQQGINGYLFDENDFVRNTSEKICYYMNNISEYQKICFASYNRFSDTLNWGVAANMLLNSIKESI